MLTAIEAEKEQQQFRAGIENFDPTKLKPTVTKEKNTLPTKEGKLQKFGLFVRRPPSHTRGFFNPFMSCRYLNNETSFRFYGTPLIHLQNNTITV